MGDSDSQIYANKKEIKKSIPKCELVNGHNMKILVEEDEQTHVHRSLEVKR